MLLSMHFHSLLKREEKSCKIVAHDLFASLCLYFLQRHFIQSTSNYGNSSKKHLILDTGVHARYIRKNAQDNGYGCDTLLSTDFIYGFNMIKKK